MLTIAHKAFPKLLANKLAPALQFCITGLLSSPLHLFNTSISQGSPFLLAIAVNGLSWLLQNRIATGLIRGIAHHTPFNLQRFGDESNALAHNHGLRFPLIGIPIWLSVTLIRRGNWMLKRLGEGFNIGKGFQLSAAVLNYLVIPAMLCLLTPGSALQQQLDSVCTRFLWAGKMEGNSLQKGNWDMCAHHREKGIVNIRDILSCKDHPVSLPARNVALLCQECMPMCKELPLTTVFCRIRAKGASLDKRVWRAWKKLKSKLRLKVKSNVEVTMYYNETVWSICEDGKDIELWVDVGQHSKGHCRQILPTRETSLVKSSGKQQVEGFLAAKKIFNEKHVVGLMDSPPLLRLTSS